MSDDALRIAMWSGPRNISTALMRSFEARGDSAVIDEPFYAAYLRHSGVVHPLGDEVLASQPNDWQTVSTGLLGPVPGGLPIYYQKHMTHHMLPQFGLAWMERVRNVFLIRDPRAVLASYVRKRAEVNLSDIGVVRQRELFEREAERLGAAPPVIDGADVQADPAGVLAQLCAALQIPFVERMLRWPPGRRCTDGVWAPAWYAAVERSSGFEPPQRSAPPELPEELQRIADAARPHYERMAPHRLATRI
jgi:hypothetical protein